MFVRVKDKSTGHEFDVPESDPRIGGSLQKLSKDHYPPSRLIRRPKYNVGRKPAPVTTKPSVETESKEDKTNG